LLRGFKFARAAYVMFAVAVLLALLKLGGFGVHPLFLRIVPTETVAKAAESVTGEDASKGEALDLPDADSPTSGSVGRLLTLASRVSNLPSRGESARTGEPSRDDTTVFYRPSTDGEPVCGNLGDFPKSSRAVFPLSSDYFDSYEDTWGAARPQGGHEGTDLMSPTGTPEFAITDGTIVPVKGANKNGWNMLGGYTVMLQAAYDAGPIKKGDLFYYAHMDEESTLKLGTKVRAGQQIGVVGDTGEGGEATRGKFPPHLHLGWYDTGSAGSRTDLESGAMDPYPLLLWLEANGGAVTGGTDAVYCEAPQGSEPSADEDSSSGHTNPDLDTGDVNDARPSPAVEESRHDHPQEPRSKPDEEKKPDKAGTQTDAQTKDEVSANESDKQDEAESVSDETPTSNASRPTPLLSNPRSDWVFQPSFAQDPAEEDGDRQDTEPPVEKEARKPPPDLPKDKEPKDRTQPTPCDPPEKADEGNLVRVTRHQAPIKREEWLALLRADPDMRACKAGESDQKLSYKDLAIWTGHPGHDEVRFYLRGGEIVVKNPDDPTIQKMRKIADALGARVRYNDGEKE
jgi:murein DD-endopeptidase MepM/ murein hydrolase activator NlpD